MRREFVYDIRVRLPEDWHTLDLDVLSDLVTLDDVDGHVFQESNLTTIMDALKRAGATGELKSADVHVELEEQEITAVIDQIKDQLAKRIIHSPLWLHTNLVNNEHVTYAGHPALTDYVTQGPTRFVTQDDKYKSEIIDSPLWLQAFREFGKAHTAGALTGVYLDDLLYVRNEQNGIKVFSFLESN